MRLPGIRDLVFLGTLAGAAALLAAGVLRPHRPASGDLAKPPTTSPAPAEVVPRVDDSFRKSWKALGIEPAPPASDLTRMRRLSVALTGAIPSIEEIRRFESRPPGHRVEPWLDEILADRRTADYLAERLARAYVGTEDGPFLLFRRRRFTTWLSDQIHANRPYDAIVRDLVAEDGLWLDRPATNFVTAAYSQETELPDAEKLAIRVSRAFLGVRLDCAQCHDHPFTDWKQDDFRGLAAFFGSTRSNLRGIRDSTPHYEPLDPETNEPKAINPAVPFYPASLPADGGPRRRLARWLADPENPHLTRATVNRVWALLLGRPLSDPVDDLPPEGELPEPLVLLAGDFAAHRYDLRHLIRAIARTEVFRLDSATVSGDGPTDLQEAHWAAFPLTPARPEQVAESLNQAASLATIGPRSHWLTRLVALTSRGDFVRRYGDTGEDEFDAPCGTIPQRLLLMNGELVRERTKGENFQAPSIIAQLAPDDPSAVELAYLSVLTRRPTAEESSHFVARLDGATGDDRTERLTDLFWTLLNSTEFSWTH